MKKIISYYALIHFFFYPFAFGSSSVDFFKKTPAKRQTGNFSTLIKTSLEESIKKPQNPISLSILPFLSKKSLATDDMGNLKVFNHPDYVAISIEGKIYKNLHHDINFWLDKYDKNKNKSLIFLIDSPGGYVKPIIEIEEKIDTQRLTTIVTGQALSAAASLFLLGKQKIMLSSTQLGFHASRLNNKQESAEDGLFLNKLFLSNSKNLKNKNKWENFLFKIYLMGAFESLNMTYYAAEELLKQNLIQKVSTPKIIINRFWLKPQNLSLQCKKIFS